MSLKIKLSLACLFVLCNIALCGKFPKDFAWGVGSAAYSVEGAWNISGRGPSIWDTFVHFPGRTAKNHTGDVAIDFYHRYPEDIALMKSLGIKNFKMSISWSRILPKGTVNLQTNEGVNQAGVDYYNKVFDTLHAAGIEPWVTLYHWDLPQALDDKTSKGGWLNADIAHKFNDYADFCFRTFGDKVKKWITFDDIWVYSFVGYDAGAHAPGRCSPSRGFWCEEAARHGNGSTEPYIVAHNSLISHALAVQTYRTKYQKQQKGIIGITSDTEYTLPFDPKNPKDVEAAETHLAFRFGWLVDPIVFGKYPDAMRKLVSGNRLPEFNETMSALLKGSFDFIGVDTYTTRYIKWTGKQGDDWHSDGQYEQKYVDVNGKELGAKAAVDWLRVYPKGMRLLLNYIKKRYGDHPLYIFGNGFSIPGESNLPLKEALDDTMRINYLKSYIANMVLAMTHDKVNVKGYFGAFTDSYEWTDGYDVRSGTVYVDYNNGLKRHVKKSGNWYSKLITNIAKEGTGKLFKGIPKTDLIQE